MAKYRSVSFTKYSRFKTSLDAITTLCYQVTQWLEETEKLGKINQNILITLLYFALWGNRVDLSLWSAFESDRSNFDIENQKAHILVDDAGLVTELLMSSACQRVDFIVDNAGFELICDLCLVDFY